MSDLARVVVVGASLAGLRACETLRREGFGGEITVVDAQTDVFYDRPPLSKQFLAGQWGPEHLELRPLDLLSSLGLSLRLGDAAVGLDLEGHNLELEGGSRLRYDGLVLAAGAVARRLPGTIDPAAISLVLRSRSDAVSLRAALVQGARLVVVGAGFLGLEVAATARGLGCDVEVVEPLGQPLARVLGERVGAAFARLHADNGVSLHLETSVDGLSALGARWLVQVSGVRPGAGGPEALEADVVLAAIGARAADTWLGGSGLELDGGVVCDETLTAAPGVVVAGDLARVRLPDGSSERVEHWTTAAEQGVHAARSLLAGPAASAFETVHYFWSDQYGLKLQAIGRPAPDCAVEVVDGSLEQGRFVACYGRDGLLAAAVALGRPRQLMAYRPLLERPTPFAEALALAR